MTGARVFFLALYGLLALLGLFTAAKAQDIGMSIFGFGLIGFSLFCIFHTIKTHFDQAEANH
jgi:Na+/phosphate symporter